MQRRRNSVGFAMAIAAVASACAAPMSEPAVHEVVGETGIVVVPNALELDFDFCGGIGDDGPGGTTCGLDGHIGLRVVACSASFSCKDSFLADPITLERGPTVMTGFTCGFGGGIEQDALLAFHPEWRCYTGGQLGDRSTWVPAGGIAITPDVGEHLFFSREGQQQGDVYTNSATLMRPLREVAGPNGFCELHAWGSVAFSDMVVGQREAEHVTRAPAVEWRAVLKWTGGSWDCNLGVPALTSLERVLLASATHDQPAPTNRGDLPASHGVVLVREEPLVGVAGVSTTFPQKGARLRFSNNSWFPLDPDDVPEPLTERQLWVNNPNTPTPADLRITASCAQLGPTGVVSAIGMRISDGYHVPLGVIVVHASTAGTPWDCERNLDDSCVLLEDGLWEAHVPCLMTP